SHQPEGAPDWGQREHWPAPGPPWAAGRARGPASGRRASSWMGSSVRKLRVVAAEHRGENWARGWRCRTESWAGVTRPDARPVPTVPPNARLGKIESPIAAP